MRYFLYCRKSTDTEDKQVMSLESQERELLETAAKNGLEVIKVLRESKSAKAEGRPVFDAMLADIQAKKAEGILCWKLDRLARNMADGGRVIDLLQRGVIREVRTHEAIHLPSENVLLLAVQLGMANQYIRDLSENVKRGNRAKLERGEWPNQAPYGYKNDKATKKVVVDKKTSSAVVRIYQLYATGAYSMQDVVNELYAEGFRTSVGTKIIRSRIESVLKNPFYIGLMERGGKYYPGVHKAFIPKALYEQAQLVLKGTTRPKSQRLLFPLRGLLVCADCTCLYTASLKKGHQYYYCTNGKGICTAHSRYMRSEPATELVAEALGRVRFDAEIIEIMYEAARERYQDRFSFTDAIRKRLRGQLDSLERVEIKAFEDSSSGLLRAELYERKMRDVQRERLNLTSELNNLRLQDGLATLEPTKEAFKTANTALERFLHADPALQKGIASEVLWNLSVKDGKIQEVRYKSYFNVMANGPKNGLPEEMLAD